MRALAAAAAVFSLAGCLDIKPFDADAWPATLDDVDAQSSDVSDTSDAADVDVQDDADDTGPPDAADADADTAVDADADADTTLDADADTDAEIGPQDCSHLDEGCLVGVWNAETTSCEVVPADQGTPCDDGDLCTEDDGCAGFGDVCEGTAKDCDDGKSCSPDSCEAATGKCVHDVSTCTCVVDGDCDDGDDCTIDSCNANGQCVTTVDSGAACDDGDACTESDTCLSNGSCVGSAKSCTDGNPCTTDGCDSATGDCLFPGDVGKGCDDGDVCTDSDQCQADGACAGATKDCDDGLDCTLDSCSASTGLCLHDTSACPCETAAECDDGNACTDDACNTTLFTCEHAVDVTNVCSDGTLCTTSDTCQPDGSCAGIATVCDDGNPCTSDVCDTATGTCAFEPLADGTSCDDGDACTVGDTCQAGACEPGLPKAFVKSLGLGVGASIEVLDDGYLVAGWNHDQKGLVIRTNNSGEVVWTYVRENQSNQLDSIYTDSLLVGGEVSLVGRLITSPPSAGGLHSRVSLSGDLVDEQALGSSVGNFLPSMLKTIDGTNYILGRSSNGTYHEAALLEVGGVGLYGTPWLAGGSGGRWCWDADLVGEDVVVGAGTLPPQPGGFLRSLGDAVGAVPGDLISTDPVQYVFGVSSNEAVVIQGPNAQIRRLSNIDTAPLTDVWPGVEFGLGMGVTYEFGAQAEAVGLRSAAVLAGENLLIFSRVGQYFQTVGVDIGTGSVSVDTMYQDASVSNIALHDTKPLPSGAGYIAVGTSLGSTLDPADDELVLVRLTLDGAPVCP